MDIPSLEYPAIRDLSQYPHWVCWRTEIRNTPKGPKATKVPISAVSGGTYRASVTEKRTWATFAQAVECWQMQDGINGIGIVLSRKEKQNLLGCDLDKCRNPETGEIASWAMDIIKKINTYTEVSPSGTGIRMFGRGAMGGDRRRVNADPVAVEFYDDERYLTVTGNHLTGCPETLNEIGDVATAIMLDLVANLDRQKKKRAASRQTADLLDQPAQPKAVNGTTPSFSRRPRAPEINELESVLEPYALPDANPPQDRFTALKANVVAFAKTWDRDRSDAKGWTASEYDLALANYFISANWDNIQIMQGLIAHRRAHGSDLKLDRNPRCDYYARTIRAAHRNRYREQAEDSLSKRYESIDDEARNEILDNLSIVFDVDVKRIIKYVSDEPTYTIETDRGEVSGPIEMITGQNRFRNAFAAITGVLVYKAKQNRFDTRAQAILRVAEIKETSEESTEVGQMRSWLLEYVGSIQRMSFDRQLSDEEINSGSPFVDKDELFVYCGHVADWLLRKKSQRIETRKLAYLLSKMGCVNKTKTFYLVSGRKTSKSYFHVPSRVVG